MYTGQQFDMALKAKADLFLMSSQMRDSFNPVTPACSCSSVAALVNLRHPLWYRPTPPRARAIGARRSGRRAESAKVSRKQVRKLTKRAMLLD